MSEFEREEVQASVSPVMNSRPAQPEDIRPAQAVEVVPAKEHASFTGKEILTELARVLGGSAALGLVAAALAADLPIVGGAALAGAAIGYLIKHVDESKDKDSDRSAVSAVR